MLSQGEVLQHYIPSRRPGCMRLLLAASKQVTTCEYRHSIRLSCLRSRAWIIAKLGLAEDAFTSSKCSNRSRDCKQGSVRGRD